jgi:hypothetical protein
MFILSLLASILLASQGGLGGDIHTLFRLNPDSASEVRIFDSTGLLRAYYFNYDNSYKVKIELQKELISSSTLYLENFSGEKIIPEKSELNKIFSFREVETGVWQIKPNSAKVVKVTIF